ncbi:MAG: M48 family metallopeptidase [Propionibacteriaceae bacterium]|nr:M48 family metallopeptidase [Propionibacteriaceae bacterium]
MKKKSAVLTIAGIEIDVVYKDVKNFNIRVGLPSGSVRVSVPKWVSEAEVCDAIKRRMPWIKQQRERILAAPQPSGFDLVDGEIHYAWGVPLTLKVIDYDRRAVVEIDGGYLVLYAKANTSTQKRREYLDRWYRDELRSVLPELIAKWERQLRVSVSHWKLRRMKTRWGSCNCETRQLTFNTELAKRPPECLKYVVVHEMMHYFERNHGKDFKSRMDVVLPGWRSRKALLNSVPIDFE